MKRSAPPARLRDAGPLAALLAVALLLVYPVSSGATEPSSEPISFESLLKEMVDRDRIARLPDPAYQQLQESSWNRAAQTTNGQKAQPMAEELEGWFANRDRGAYLRTEERDGRTEYVMADHQGPGAIVRIWSANPSAGGTLRFYLDGAEEPVIEQPFADFTAGKGLVKGPLSAIRARGHNLYLPIPFADRCKITIDDNVGRGVFYIVNFRAYEEGTEVESFSMDDLEEHAELLASVQRQFKNPGRNALDKHRKQSQQKTLQPGESVSLEFSGGPAAVRELTVKLNPPEIQDADKALRHLILKASADGEETIHAPVGDFFGSGLGLNPFEDWYRSVMVDGTMTARWVMPFQQQQSFTLENKGDQPVEVSLAAKVGEWEWDDRSMTFRTNYRQERDIPTRPRKDFNFIAIDGTGVFVGDTLAISNPTPAWWGEGDEKIYVDDETFPAHFGTGTEDYYGYAWCDPSLFSAPFHAQPRADGPRNFGHVTNSRVRSLDAIPFDDRFIFDMEVWHWQDVTVSMAATTHWYGRPGVQATGPAASDEKDLGIMKLPDIPTFEGAIEGEELRVVNKNGPFPANRQNLWGQHEGTWSAGAHLWVRPQQVGKFIELRIPTPDQKPQRLTLWFTKASDYGIVQVSVNGEKLGAPVDLWSEKVVPTGPTAIGTFTPSDDASVLRLEIVGKNPRSRRSGTSLGLDAVKLTPVEEASGASTGVEASANGGMN